MLVLVLVARVEQAFGEGEERDGCDGHAARWAALPQGRFWLPGLLLVLATRSLSA